MRRPAFIHDSRITLVLALSSGLWVGCQVSREASRLDGYATGKQILTLWPDRNDIPVCWESPEPADSIAQTEPVKEEDSFLPSPENRKQVEELVNREYGKAGFRFTGWGDCDANSPGIHVKVRYQGQDKTEQLGVMISGFQDGMKLNWARKCGAAVPTSTCVLNTALHEFGHALGLRHEMNRPDQVGCEKDQTKGQGEAGALQIGLYDPESVMSYCRDRTNLTLSDGDINTLRDYYEGPIANPFVGAVYENPSDEVYFLLDSSAVPNFRYLLTPDSQACLNEAAYSESQSAERVLQLDVASYPRGKEITLCLLGQDEAGRWQATRSFSSVTWLRTETNHPL